MNSLPVIYKRWKSSWLCGLIVIDYSIEDRRPDLQVGDYLYKYKHRIKVKVFWKTYVWILHTIISYDSNPFEG